jgi:hypothetical protein
MPLSIRADLEKLINNNDPFIIDPGCGQKKKSGRISIQISESIFSCSGLFSGPLFSFPRVSRKQWDLFLGLYYCVMELYELHLCY